MKLQILLLLLIIFTNLFHLFGQNNPHSNKKVISVEVQEVQELIYIIFAITDEGIKDSILINHYCDYYQKVRLHFDKYKNEKIVSKIGRKIANNHYQIQMDATNYYFDKNDNLVKNKEYHNLSWGKKDYLKSYLSELENFSRKTDFRKFYKDNRTYYDSLISLIQTQAPVDKQVYWLENKFLRKYDTINVIFSPLNNGKHATNYTLNDLTIWVSRAYRNTTISTTLNEAFSSRMLFTEIDHNYVNPISDLYINEINTSFKQRAKWVDNSKVSAYPNPYSVFNEYMTWSVFILFAYDTYNESDFIIIKNRVEDMMISYRGFHNFKTFNEKMLELYKNNTTKTLISDLYPDILEWSANQ